MSDTQTHQWIPVSERLPEVRHVKLVYAELRNTYKAYLDELNVWWNAERPNERLTNVTHWMDLPEPPAPLKPADPFEAWWWLNRNAVKFCMGDARLAWDGGWDAAKEHYAKPNDYQRGLQDSVIAFESMVDRILEGKEGGTGKLEIPALEKLRRVLLERLKPLPDFEAWWKTIPLREDCEANVRDVGMWFVHMRCARAIWNAAQGKPEA